MRDGIVQGIRVCLVWESVELKDLYLEERCPYSWKHGIDRIETTIFSWMGS